MVIFNKQTNFSIAFFAFLFLGNQQVFAQLEDPEYIQLTQISYQSGDEKEAYRLLGSLEKKYPDNGYILSEKGGWQLYFENDINLALITLSKSLKLIPANDVALTLRGIAFDRKGLTEKAIQDQKDAIAINPEPIMYYIYLGRYHYVLAQYNEALTSFLKALKMDSTAIEIYQDVFATYAKLHQAFDAQQLFEKGLKVEGIDIGMLRCSYGNFLMRIQKFEAASQQYQMAYDMPEPHLYAEDYHDAAISYFKINQLQKALFFIDIAIKNDPQEVIYLTNKADIAMNLKDWNLVMATSKKAIDLDPKSALAHMYMSIGLKSGPGKMEESKRYEDKANELDQTNK